MEFLFAEFVGKPAWMWLAFVALVGGLLWLDLGVLNKNDHVIGPKESFLQAGFYVTMGLLFGATCCGTSAARPRSNTTPATWSS